MVDPFALTEDALEAQNPTGWRWYDIKEGVEHDGRKLVGFYVADDVYERDDREVPIKVIRTKDGRYRSLFLWPGDEERVANGEFDRNEQLIQVWDSMSAEHGDVVAVQLDVRTSDAGRRYGIFTAAVTKAAELKSLGYGAAPDVDDQQPKAQDDDDIPF
jgi:hypothetical protein